MNLLFNCIMTYNVPPCVMGTEKSLVRFSMTGTWDFEIFPPLVPITDIQIC